ncbi:TetR/AcrR family transcriptional regulator [Sphingobacterium sp. ML3W]|uniref:TetR/AcrR family transcriptional regulator n=1 Tax=Sphingobacterium sp. ML3W TaxID=1538644 RepID=UPI00249BAADD|nr:TetR/AcrR family transcriptional regulator [Sphingobacterium sp. ML3W]WFA81356.1 TetR/AcrR family transcriptional regulator [Sphingobacterium sp. ML3W]
MPRNKEFDYFEKLEIVRNLFWEKGYHATSMNDIVDALELNRSSIYNTYGNKHTLFLKCLENYAKMKTAQYKKATSYDGSSFEILGHTVHDVMHQTIQDKKACLIIRTIFELGDSDPLVNHLITTNAKVLEEIFRTLIEKSIVENDIKHNILPEVAARCILSSFSGFYRHYIVSGKKAEVEQMIDFMLSSMRA